MFCFLNYKYFYTFDIYMKCKYTHAKKKKATPNFLLGSFDLHSNLLVTYRPILCGWRPSHTFYANLSKCLKQFSLPARQCQHTCNMTRNCLQACHVIPLDQPPMSQSISDQPPQDNLFVFVWFDSLRPLNNLSVKRDGSSWVEPVLS